MSAPFSKSWNENRSPLGPAISASNRRQEDVALSHLQGSGTPVVVAHRGASGLAPENTLEALYLALELGVDWVEVDVQRTSDGIPVLVHDTSWQRVSGLDLEVRRTPWSKVRDLDLGSWFAPRYAGARPASLDEALDLVHEGLHLNLEIKSPQLDRSLASVIVETVCKRNLQDQVLLTSFDHACIDALAALGIGLRVGYLATTNVPSAASGVCTLALGSECILSEPQSVDRAHRAGRRVWAWTVDDPIVFWQLADLGVDAIITNHPERFVPPWTEQG